MASIPFRRLSRVLEQTLSERLSSKELEPPPRLAVAYSGGRDSGVLLALCSWLWPGRVSAIYVDHGWRPVEERTKELALVGRVCRRFECPLVTYGPPEKTVVLAKNREASARDYRYAFFEQYHSEHPSDTIVLAHHAQDQAETILMRLLQGRSWRGLGGIPASRGPFVRPFLDVWPRDLEAAATELALEVSLDSSNSDESLVRNALRRSIVPLLETSFPSASRSLVRFGRVWSELQPPGSIDPAWSLDPLQARVDRSLWDSWSGLDRGNQLLALASSWKPSRYPRRFVDSLLSGGESGGFRLRLEKTVVIWETVVKRPGLQYFRETAEGQPVDLGVGEALWSRTTGVDVLDRGRGNDELPVFVASHDAVAVQRWRSLLRDTVPLASRGALRTSVYWLMGTEVRGVFDLETWAWLWKPEPSAGAPGLWVTLRRRAYERR